MSNNPSAAEWLDAAILARLRGETPAPPDADPHLAERAAEGDATAQAAVDVVAQEALWADRIARARGLEGADVVLMDGSKMSLDDAEKLLAKREERAAHLELRRSIDNAASPFRHFNERRSSNAGAVEAAAAFLLATRPARDAARDALASLGGEPLESPPALLRALDLPDADGGFAEAPMLGLLLAAREAAGPALRRGPKRIAVPRRLAGLVLEHLPEVRFGTGRPTVRFARHAAGVVGGMRALAASAGAPAELGVAMALGLLTAPVRRTVLGEARADAERRGRIAAATLLLEVRAAAALEQLAPTGFEGDVAREALIEAWGADPGPGATLDQVDSFDGALAQAWRRAAGVWTAWREAHDEQLPLRRAAWAGAAEWAPGSAGDDAAAWVRVAEELL